MSFSVDPITGTRYSLPSSLDDESRIDSFLTYNRNKAVVVVQGLGFVGAVMSLVVANALDSEYAVIGVDLPNVSGYWKICSINEGRFPIKSSDPKVEIYFKSARQKGNLLATFDPYAYSKADVIVVDINLDVQKITDQSRYISDFNVDLTGFKKAIEVIGASCRNDALILVETTVPPGTCMEIVHPIVAKCMEKRGLENKVRIGHSYERVMPGPGYIDSIQNFYRVFAGIDDPSANHTERFLKSIIRTDQYPLTRLHNTTASEMAKVLENSFRAMNIAFIQEWTEFAEVAGVNLNDIISAIRMRSTHANIMRPGLGVGGYCLTKDPLLASWSRRNIFSDSEGLSQSESAVQINDRMPYHALGIIEEWGQTNVLENCLLLGVSYLSDVGDTRYTPVEVIYTQLLEKGCNITAYDPYVNFWEECNTTVSNDSVGIWDSGNYDVIVISTAHSIFRNNQDLINFILKNKPALIVDAWGILSDSTIDRITNKHTVRVLGRGDIL